VPLQRVIEVAEFRTGLVAFLRETERVSRRWGLTPQRYLLLLAIKGAPDGSERLSFTEVAQRLQLSRNSVTELVARAEEAGLVEREQRSQDLRVVHLRVTAEGERRLLGVLGESHEDRVELRKAFDGLSATF
jgi:DNA-binding MarR family transcriptional regulator